MRQVLLAALNAATLAVQIHCYKYQPQSFSLLVTIGVSILLGYFIAGLVQALSSD